MKNEIMIRKDWLWYLAVPFLFIIILCAEDVLDDLTLAVVLTGFAFMGVLSFVRYMRETRQKDDKTD